MRRMFLLITWISILAISLSGCGRKTNPAAETPSPTDSGIQPPAGQVTEGTPLQPQPADTAGPGEPQVTPNGKKLILASTELAKYSGILKLLVPAFESQSGYPVEVLTSSSTKAMDLGAEGKADVLLVHAPFAEESFIDKGLGIERALVMHGDMVIIGPPEDPAGIRGLTSAAEAFRKIGAAQAPFISRSDVSDTRTLEMVIWQKAKFDPKGNWYMPPGQDVFATLELAAAYRAYTLVDRYSYLASRDKMAGLEILVQGDVYLMNVFHVIIVNPEKWPTVNVEGARAFAAYITSPAVQTRLGNLGMTQLGQQVFFPDAGKTDADLGIPSQLP